MNYEFIKSEITIKGNNYEITSEQKTKFGNVGIYSFIIYETSDNFLGLIRIGNIGIYEALIKSGEVELIRFRSTSTDQLLTDVINYLTYALTS